MILKVSRHAAKRDLYQQIITQYPSAGKFFAQEWSEKIAKHIKEDLQNYDNCKLEPLNIKIPLGTKTISCFINVDKTLEYIHQKNIGPESVLTTNFVSYSSEKSITPSAIRFSYKLSSEPLPEMPIIILDSFEGTKIVIDGNHRVSHAVTIGSPSIFAYVLQDSEIFYPESPIYLNKCSELLHQFYQELKPFIDDDNTQEN